jgi:hypothetical protein
LTDQEIGATALSSGPFSERKDFAGACAVPPHHFGAVPLISRAFHDHASCILRAIIFPAGRRVAVHE